MFTLPLLHFPVLAPILRPTACLLLATTLRLLRTEDFPEEDQRANELGRQSEAKRKLLEVDAFEFLREESKAEI